MKNKYIGFCHWWDENSQEGIMKVEGLGGVYFNNERKHEVMFKDHEPVEVEVIFDTTFQQCTSVKKIPLFEAEDFYSYMLVRALDSNDDSEIRYWMFNLYKWQGWAME